MNPAIVRIIVRYVAGLLLGAGLLTQDSVDLVNDESTIEAVLAGLGIVLAVGTEIFYALAKKYNWRK